ncbi:PA14 domain-containing protein [Hymenobacter algoricola]|uniref:PA14 domain-containing protein n=1 Tax=Hymenobacter algoricola TaxID=486267 RepID=A0ABP7N0B9_9BACT
MLCRLRFRLLLATLLLLLLLAGRLRAQPRPATPGDGLRGHYYDGQNFGQLVLTRVDPTIDFNWTIEGPSPAGRTFAAPGPGVPPEYFSVRWLGHIYIPVTGRYTFRILNDDGMRVWLGGKRILSAWRDQVATESAAEIQLTGGRYYPLRVEYCQVQWDTRAQLTWQQPGAAAEPRPIPTASLYATLPPSARPISAPATARPAAPTAPAAAPAPPSRVASRPTVRPTVSRGAKPAPRRRPVLPRRGAALPAADSLTTAVPDLATLRKGAVVPLTNLYFTQSTATLLPASRPLLNQLARTLRARPALRLEIAGHTDNVGEPALNLRLSEQRARTVRQYLVQQGIDSVRLTARGYGGTRPVADNHDPGQRPRNRRVEVVVQ